MQGEIFFLNLNIELSRPMTVADSDGKQLEEALRRFSVSLPIVDKERAEQMMDHLAHGFAAIFREVEQHDQARRETAKAVSGDTGGDVGGGDDFEIAVTPTAEIAGPGSRDIDNVGSHISPCVDVVGGAEGTGKEA